jgi:hypothetical protein
MASRIVCPECESVLRPARPVPDGKRVTCPKCQTQFTTPGLVEERRERPEKAKAGAKKGAAKKPAEEPVKKKPADEPEEDGGGIYKYVEEEAKTEEESEAHNITYAPDMSIKDLRGPAQAKVVVPSNYIILLSGLSCLCDILIICVSFWPMVFAEHVVDHQEFLETHYKREGGKDAKNKLASIPKDRKDVKPEELALIEEAEEQQIFWRFINLGVFVLLLVYNGVTIIGAVKMQNLESRGWGLAAAIMCILPFSASGLGSVVSFLFYLLFAVLLDDASMGLMYGSGGGVIVWILFILVGVSSLRTLMDPQVIDGFNYVPE